MTTRNALGRVLNTYDRIDFARTDRWFLHERVLQDAIGYCFDCRRDVLQGRVLGCHGTLLSSWLAWANLKRPRIFFFSEFDQVLEAVYERGQGPVIIEGCVLLSPLAAAAFASSNLLPKEN